MGGGLIREGGWVNREGAGLNRAFMVFHLRHTFNTMYLDTFEKAVKTPTATPLLKLSEYLSGKTKRTLKYLGYLICNSSIVPCKSKPYYTLLTVLIFSRNNYEDWELACKGCMCGYNRTKDSYNGTI